MSNRRVARKICEAVERRGDVLPRESLILNCTNGPSAVSDDPFERHSLGSVCEKHAAVVCRVPLANRALSCGVFRGPCTVLVRSDIYRGPKLLLAVEEKEAGSTKIPRRRLTELLAIVSPSGDCAVVGIAPHLMYRGLPFSFCRASALGRYGSV